MQTAENLFSFNHSNETNTTNKMPTRPGLRLATAGSDPIPFDLSTLEVDDRRSQTMTHPNSKYSRYRQALESGEISLDALWRIIRHDETASWAGNINSWGRKLLFNQALAGEVNYAKPNDSPGDLLYKNGWPLPPF